MEGSLKQIRDHSSVFGNRCTKDDGPSTGWYDLFCIEARWEMHGYRGSVSQFFVSCRATPLSVMTPFQTGWGSL